MRASRSAVGSSVSMVPQPHTAGLDQGRAAFFAFLAWRFSLRVAEADFLLCLPPLSFDAIRRLLQGLLQFLSGTLSQPSAPADGAPGDSNLLYSRMPGGPSRHLFPRARVGFGTIASRGGGPARIARMALGRLMARLMRTCGRFA